MEFQTTRPSTIGAEVEFMVLEDSGRPADMDLWLRKHHGGEIQTPAGKICTDLARWQGEFKPAPVPFDHPGELFMNVCLLEETLKKMMPSSWNIIYRGDTEGFIAMEPEELDHWMSRNPRYRTVIRALEILTPGASEMVLRVMLGNATHLHFSNGQFFDPYTNDDVIRIMNHLNHRGLLLAARYDEKCGLRPNRNSRVWSDFAPPNRFPSARVWQSAREYADFVRSIPRLISSDKEGTVRVDLEQPGNLSDPLFRGAIWHGMRGAGETESKRWIEYRYASSMPPHDFLSFLTQLCGEVERCIEFGPEILAEDEWLDLF